MPSSFSDEPVFVAQMLAPDATPLAAEDVAPFWTRLFGSEATPVPAPAPIGPGWRAMAFEIVPDATAAAADGRLLRSRPQRVAVVEHQLQRGKQVLRIGYFIYEPAGGEAEPAGRGWSRSSGRERLYDRVVRTVVAGEPPELVEERAKWERNPRSPSRAYAYAVQLSRAGMRAEADALLAELTARQDGWAWDAARLRLELWHEDSQLSQLPAVASEGDGSATARPPPANSEDAGWLEPFLLQAPLADVTVHRLGTAYLQAQGDCEGVRAHLQRVQRLVAEASATPGQTLSRREARAQRATQRAAEPCIDGSDSGATLQPDAEPSPSHRATDASADSPNLREPPSAP